MAEDDALQAGAEPATARPLKRRQRSMLSAALQIALIGAGVFLGLAGDEWREHARNRRQAAASLQGFRAEIVNNRRAVEAVVEYHATVLTGLRAYLNADRTVRNTSAVRMQGLRMVAFEHTAWDLALATQSLAHIDQDLAFALSRVYNEQHRIAELSRGMTQAMYLLPLREEFDAFAGAAETFFADMVVMEPALIALYDETLARLDGALGGAPR